MGCHSFHIFPVSPISSFLNCFSFLVFLLCFKTLHLFITCSMLTWLITPVSGIWIYTRLCWKNLYLGLLRSAKPNCWKNCTVRDDCWESRPEKEGFFFFASFSFLFFWLIPILYSFYKSVVFSFLVFCCPLVQSFIHKIFTMKDREVIGSSDFPGESLFAFHYLFPLEKI